jgi:phosphatidylserine/phosphatidylglycerophosphate/cardiolipin synthase-like enzyme
VKRFIFKGQKSFFLIWVISFFSSFLYYIYTNDVPKNIINFFGENFNSKHFIINGNGDWEPIVKPSNFKKIFDVDKKQSQEFNQNSLLTKLGKQKGYVTLFSPDENVHDLLLTLIKAEKEKMRIAIFSFSDVIILRALQDALKNKVLVEVIVDRGCIADRYSKINDLYKSGAKIYVYNPSYSNKVMGLMHHKFIIFLKNYTNSGLLWTGSYNFTKSARYHNQENVVVMNRKGAVNRYNKQFDHMLECCDIYKPFEPVQKPLH